MERVNRTCTGNRGPNHRLKTTKALYIREENSPDRRGQRQPIETLERNRDSRSWPLRPRCKQTKQQRNPGTDSQLIIGGTNKYNFCYPRPYARVGWRASGSEQVCLIGWKKPMRHPGSEGLVRWPGAKKWVISWAADAKLSAVMPVGRGLPPNSEGLACWLTMAWR